jgi:hypothetical protein
MSAISNCLIPTCTHFTDSKASNLLLAPEIPDSPDSALCAELKNVVIAVDKPQGSPDATTMQTEAAAKQPSWACDSKHDKHPSNLQEDEHLVSVNLGAAGKSSTWHTSKAWQSQSALEMFPSSFSYVGFPVLDMSLSDAGEAADAQDADEGKALESSIDEVQALEPSIFRDKKDQKQFKVRQIHNIEEHCTEATAASAAAAETIAGTASNLLRYPIPAMSWLFDGRLAQGCRGHMPPQTLGMEAIPLQTPNKQLQPHANERDIEDRGQRERCAVDILKAGVKEEDALRTPRSKAGALAKAATDRALNANRSCVCL